MSENDEFNRQMQRMANEQAKEWSNQPAIPYNPRPGFNTNVMDYGPELQRQERNSIKLEERIAALENTPYAKKEDLDGALIKVIPLFAESFREVTETNFAKLDENFAEYARRIQALEDAMEMITPVGFAKDREWARKTDERIKALETTHLNSAGGVYERLSKLEAGQLGAKGQVIVEFNEQIRKLKYELSRLHQYVGALEERINLLDADDEPRIPADENGPVRCGTFEEVETMQDEIAKLVRAAREWHEDWCAKHGVDIPGKAFTLKNPKASKPEGLLAHELAIALNPFGYIK